LPAHIIWLMERGDADSMVAKSYFPGNPKTPFQMR
jgi:hypothetical protein